MTELAFERRCREWAEQAGVRWETLRYQRPEAGGETVAHKLTPAGSPAAVTITVHGAGNDALFAMVGLFQRLLAAGHQIVAFDLDGHGRSSTTRLSADAAPSAIPAALAATGVGHADLPLHLVGISLGGAITLASLPELPAPLHSAVLIAAPLRIEFSRAAILRELGPPLLQALIRERSHYGLTGLIPSFGPFKRGTYPLRLADTPPAGAFGYVEVLNDILDRLALLSAARATQVPVLLAYGGRDRLVPPSQGRLLHEAIPSSELLVAPGETHLSVHLAPEVVRRVLEWVT